MCYALLGLFVLKQLFRSNEYTLFLAPFVGFSICTTVTFIFDYARLGPAGLQRLLYYEKNKHKERERDAS